MVLGMEDVKDFVRAAQIAIKNVIPGASFAREPGIQGAPVKPSIAALDSGSRKRRVRNDSLFMSALIV